MRKLTYIAILSLLVLPVVSFAANETTLTSGAEITANGVTVTVSGGHNMDSLTVNEGNFEVVMSQSSLVVTSADRATFTVSPAQYETSFECKDDESVLTLERNQEGTDTVTVTPSSTTCSAGGGGGGISGGGGGGGGGGAAPATPATPTVTPATPATPPEAAQPSAVAQLVSPVFNRTLRVGSRGEDVKRLQQLLNADLATLIASTGVGSPGNETDFFGGLTEAAVKKFQAKHGVVSSGTPDTTGFGLVGPATRAKLKAVFSKAPAAPSVPAVAAADPELKQLVELFIALGVIPADKAEKARAVLAGQAAPQAQVALEVSPVFNQGLSRGQSHADIKRLQELLNSDPDTQVASTGAGSSGNETNFFGGLTEDAVKRFQSKHGVAGVGDPGYGYVGPKTRAKLKEVFGN